MWKLFLELTVWGIAIIFKMGGYESSRYQGKPTALDLEQGGLLDFSWIRQFGF
jgi:hypothetical protein